MSLSMPAAEPSTPRAHISDVSQFEKTLMVPSSPKCVQHGEDYVDVMARSLATPRERASV